MNLTSFLEKDRTVLERKHLKMNKKILKITHFMFSFFFSQNAMKPNKT